MAEPVGPQGGAFPHLWGEALICALCFGPDRKLSLPSRDLPQSTCLGAPRGRAGLTTAQLSGCGVSCRAEPAGIRVQRVLGVGSGRGLEDTALEAEE